MAYPMSACTDGDRLVSCGPEQLSFGAPAHSVYTAAVTSDPPTSSHPQKRDGSVTLYYPDVTLTVPSSQAFGKNAAATIAVLSKAAKLAKAQHDFDPNTVTEDLSAVGCTSTVNGIAFDCDPKPTPTSSQPTAGVYSDLVCSHPSVGIPEPRVSEFADQFCLDHIDHRFPDPNGIFGNGPLSSNMEMGPGWYVSFLVQPTLEADDNYSFVLDHTTCMTAFSQMLNSCPRMDPDTDSAGGSVTTSLTRFTITIWPDESTPVRRDISTTQDEKREVSHNSIQDIAKRDSLPPRYEALWGSTDDHNISCHFGHLASSTDLNSSVHTFCQQQSSVALQPNVLQVANISLASEFQRALLSREHTCPGANTITFANCISAFTNITIACGDDVEGFATGGQSVVDEGCTTYHLRVVDDEGDFHFDGSDSTETPTSTPQQSNAEAQHSTQLSLAPHSQPAQSNSAAISRRNTSTNAITCGTGALVPSSDLQAAATDFCHHFANSTLYPGTPQEGDIRLRSGGEATLVRMYSRNCTDRPSPSVADCKSAFQAIATTCQAAEGEGEVSGGKNVVGGCTEYTIRTGATAANTTLTTRASANNITCHSGTPLSCGPLQQAAQFLCREQWNGHILELNETLSEQIAITGSARANFTVRSECPGLFPLLGTRCLSAFEGILDDCDVGNGDTAGGATEDGDGGCTKYGLSLLWGA
ncbi:hypothetical protein LTR08_006188 [Meristemomyces frigidus]|nr:hypothetical protein LTR08_006188 [Meristemomyces frigidus]